MDIQITSDDVVGSAIKQIAVAGLDFVKLCKEQIETSGKFDLAALVTAANVSCAEVVEAYGTVSPSINAAIKEALAETGFSKK